MVSSGCCDQAHLGVNLPERYGPRTTCYNRFVRWRKAGAWDRLMDAVTQARDGRIQMIDTSIVRVHQQGATAKGGSGSLSWTFPRRADNQNPCSCGRQRQTDKADADGRPEQRHRFRTGLDQGLARRFHAVRRQGYDANALRSAVTERKAWANIPPKANRKDPICFSPFPVQGAESRRALL